MDGILKGVRILDFGRYIAGPFCAAMLGDLGADVIRVERPGGGEDRGVYPVTEGGDGALFLQCNRNKRGVTLDVKTDGGREVLSRLVASSDVVVANLPASGLRDMGLSYDQLTPIRADIILTGISAFGAAGPYADKVGFDGVGQAMSGASHLSGFDQPTKSFASWVDMSTAMLAAFATLAAVHERSRSGQGQEVHTSLFAAALTVMNFPLIEQDLSGVDRERTGNRGQSGAPADFFQTLDGWIVVQVIGDPLFRRWARLMGEDHWLTDASFAGDAARAANAAVLSERTGRWCGERTTQRALDELAAARIPAGPVLSPREVLADPQVSGSGLMTPMDYPGAPAPVSLALRATDFSRTPPRLWRRAPQAGEHTAEVLGELGFALSEIEALRRDRAI